jgi:TonB family protein
LAQSNQPLCPKHIETPVYPAIAQTAHVSGIVTLTLTIDAEGNVKDARASSKVSSLSLSYLLERPALANVRHWTFAKPPSAPYEQTIVYDFRLDGSARNGTFVSFDLPDRVTVWSEPALIEPDQTQAGKK